MKGEALHSQLISFAKSTFNMALKSISTQVCYLDPST